MITFTEGKRKKQQNRGNEFKELKNIRETRGKVPQETAQRQNTDFWKAESFSKAYY